MYLYNWFKTVELIYPNKMHTHNIHLHNILILYFKYIKAEMNIIFKVSEYLNILKQAILLDLYLEIHKM